MIFRFGLFLSDIGIFFKPISDIANKSQRIFKIFSKKNFIFRSQNKSDALVAAFILALL